MPTAKIQMATGAIVYAAGRLRFGKRKIKSALVPRLRFDAVGRLGDGPELAEVVDLPDAHPLADVVVPGGSRRNSAVR